MADHPDYRIKQCPYCQAYLSYRYDDDGKPLVSQGATESGFCPNHGEIVYTREDAEAAKEKAC